MNVRLLYGVLAVQALFAVALLYVGYRAREVRKADYLELTHRVTSGMATGEEFDKLAGFLPEFPDKAVVRALFGPPLLRAKKVEFSGSAAPAAADGDIFWLYYPNTSRQEAPQLIDVSDVEKLKGPIDCFVVRIDARGRAFPAKARVLHPLEGAEPR